MSRIKTSVKMYLCRDAGTYVRATAYVVHISLVQCLINIHGLITTSKPGAAARLILQNGWQEFRISAKNFCRGNALFIVISQLFKSET